MDEAEVLDLSELVSVVIPAYNVGPYIEDCIKSVFNQTYTNWELIVVNDGSTDSTLELAWKAAGDDPRIHIHTQPNQGSAVARNSGLSYAKGSSIIFMDGDDFWLPECLEKLVSAQEQSGAQVAYCGYNHYYMNGYNRNYRYGYPDGNIIIPAIKGEVRFHLGAMLIDKKVIDENKLKYTEGCLIGQDLEFMLKVAAVATFRAVPQNLLMYRVRPGSAINSKWNWEKHFHAVKGVRRAAEFIAEHYKESPNLSIIQSGMDIRLGKLLSKFFWHVVKTNNYQEALRIIERILEDHYYATTLEKLKKNQLSFLDRIKHQIVLSENRVLWNLAKYL